MEHRMAQMLEKIAATSKLEKASAGEDAVDRCSVCGVYERKVKSVDRVLQTPTRSCVARWTTSKRTCATSHSADSTSWRKRRSSRSPCRCVELSKQ